MALGLAELERVAQGEAEKMGQRVVRIEQGGTYNCRKMARYDWVSEHSYRERHRRARVHATKRQAHRRARALRKLDAEPTDARGRFLRAVAHRLYDEGAFSVVLTRYFDELHRDHFISTWPAIVSTALVAIRVDGVDPPGRRASAVTLTAWPFVAAGDGPDDGVGFGRHGALDDV